MTELFESNDEDLASEDPFVSPDADIELDNSENIILDARRRLEKMLEERRLRNELDDFGDY